MYIALIILVSGILVGRLTRNWLSQKCLNRLMTPAIFILLFLLGFQIGSDNALLKRLPNIGLAALLLAVTAMAGSIFCVRILKLIFKKF